MSSAKITTIVMVLLNIVVGIMNILFYTDINSEYAAIAIIVGCITNIATILLTYLLYRFVFSYVTKIINGKKTNINWIKYIYGMQGLTMMFIGYIASIYKTQSFIFSIMINVIVFIAFQIVIGMKWEYAGFVNKKYYIISAIACAALSLSGIIISNLIRVI